MQKQHTSSSSGWQFLVERSSRCVRKGEKREANERLDSWNVHIGERPDPRRADVLKKEEPDTKRENVCGMERPGAERANVREIMREDIRTT